MDTLQSRGDVMVKDFSALEKATKAAICLACEDHQYTFHVVKHYYYNSIWVRDWLRANGLRVISATDWSVVIHLPAKHRDKMMFKTFEFSKEFQKIKL